VLQLSVTIEPSPGYKITQSAFRKAGCDLLHALETWTLAAQGTFVFGLSI
jgi:hypothetical protein